MPDLVDVATAVDVATVASVAVVGAGPRATAFLERLSTSFAELLPGGRLDVSILDPSDLGAGLVWRRDQPHELVMNTFAGEVTLFTDDSVACEGPRLYGPTLYQWCRLGWGLDLSLQPLSAPGVATFRQHPVQQWVRDDERLTSEIESVLPWSHPSRQLYGAYLSWCFERVCAVAPVGLELRVIRDLVTDLTPVDRGYRLRTGSGDDLAVDVVVLSTGWLATDPTRQDEPLIEALTSAGIAWIPPGSPADQDLSSIRPGEPMIVRGLGMGFFDSMAMLTLERGGKFVAASDRGADRGLEGPRLRYLPSGNEPRLFVGSGRGVPFRSKPRYNALPPRAALRYLKAAELQTLPRPIDFTAAVWPLILKDAVDAYYQTLARVSPEAFAVDPAGLFAALDDVADVRDTGWDELVARFVPVAERRLDLNELVDPARGPFATAADFQDWVRRYLTKDLDEGLKGDRSPLKMAAWSIGSARGITANLAGYHGFTGPSYGRFLQFMALGGMLGSGPPAFRSEQLLALIDAGIVTVLGPGLQLAVDQDASTLVATSSRIPDVLVSAGVLLDAWMHLPAVSRTADPLMLSLREQGLVRGYTVGENPGFHTDRFETAPGSFLVAGDGSVVDTMYLLGIPAEGVGPPTGASPLPGTNSAFLREVDAVARSVLRTVATLAPHRVAEAAR